jgi:acetyl esterase/lipase
VLRDESEACTRKLISAGVPVAATRYLGTIHDFVMLNGLADTPAAPPSRPTDFLRQAFARQAHPFSRPRCAQFNGGRHVTHDQIREGRRA